MKPITRLLLSAPLVCATCALADPTPQTNSLAANWQQTQQRDAADTYTFTRFTLQGSFLTPPPDQSAGRPVLSIDCIPPGAMHRSKFLAADLVVGTRLKILYVEPEEIRGTNYFPQIAVRYRTDSSREDRQLWPAGTDRVPTGKPSDRRSATVPEDALRRMLHAHAVAITVNSDRGAPVRMLLEMPDPASVEAACRVD